MIAPNRSDSPLTHWKSDLVADLERVVDRDRWGVALIIVGWVHLATFVTCQVIYTVGDRHNSHYLGLWGLEFLANLGIIRRVAGPGWFRSTPLAGVVGRIWATFLILSFNLASLNSLTGFTVEWFKPAWATLSSFGFAATAYLLSYWYFVPAVQMYFTGLTMVALPQWQYLVYGISWWATFQGIGLTLEVRRNRRLQAPNRFAPAVLEFHPAEEEEVLVEQR